MSEGSRATFLEAVAARAREADVFGEVRLSDGRLVCTARDAAEPAEYRLGWDGAGGLWVSLVTPNRWLSESIETDLLHTGDKIEELIEDELVDLGHEGGTPRVEHFRSEDMLFTFRTPVQVRGDGGDEAAHAAATTLLAYEACFRQLGDMSGGDEED
jgi:hypothetical protein